MVPFFVTMSTYRLKRSVMKTVSIINGSLVHKHIKMHMGFL